MAGDIEVRAPLDQTEGTRSQVLQWLKAVGDAVNENEPLLEIETDKVTVEVAAPGAGILREILKVEQDEIEPGELLGRIAIGDTGDAAGVTDAGDAAEGRPVAVAAADSKSGSPRNVESRTPAHDNGPSRNPAADASLSPAVRRLLSEKGLEPANVQGSGPAGRITVRDVLSAGNTAPTAPAIPPTASAASAATAGSIPPTGSGTRAEGRDTEHLGPSRLVPHTAMRRRIAEHMVQSLLHSAPHVTTVFDLDMSCVLGHRERHREDFARRGAPLTLTAYFVQAAVAAVRAVPEANSRWGEQALRIFESVHVGIATAVDEGLLVPVLHDAQSLDLFGIAAALQPLVSRARAGTLTPADVRGGTFTISNHGVSGSLLAAPIVINQPQAAILGIGKLEKRAVVVSGAASEEIRIQPRCYVTLTIDHRVMDGQRANQFLQTFVQHLQDQTD
jgi:2-oxoglutarate dehydrogenase E2 component (dihydrolipoamide succinyltransferase)